MTNMLIWDAVKRPPTSVLKEIKGGRLKGFTDVNPQWRYQVMTEQFGICSIGWKYIVRRVWSESATDGQVFAFAEIELCIKAGDIWGDPIPGVGGSMLIAKEATGLHPNDEAYKMAITDALSVAMKMLGVGADIYAGFWDGTKYKGDDAKGASGDNVLEATEKPKEHWCAEHNTAYVEHRNKIGEHWFSHQKADKTWCNENKGKAKADNMPSEITTEHQEALDASHAKAETGKELLYGDVEVRNVWHPR